MESLSLILAALAAGAAAGAKDSASEAVRATYSALTSAIRRRLRDDQVGTSLAQYEANPSNRENEAALEAELAATGVASDAVILDAARKLLHCLDIDPEAAAASFHVQFHGSVYGAVTGDHNEVRMDFGSPPRPDET